MSGALCRPLSGRNPRLFCEHSVAAGDEFKTQQYDSRAASLNDSQEKNMTRDKLVVKTS